MLALAGVSVAFFALPFAGLIWRAPWSKVTDILSEKSVGTACGYHLRRH